MKRFLMLFVGICSFLTSVPAMADQAADEAAIREAMEQFNAAYNQHDAKAMASYIVENFEDWQGTRKGRKQLSEYYAQKEQYQHLDEIGIIFVTPEVAIFKARGELTGRLDADGKPLPPQKRLESWAFVKKNGKWLGAALFGRATEK